MNTGDPKIGYYVLEVLAYMLLWFCWGLPVAMTVWALVIIYKALFRWSK